MIYILKTQRDPNGPSEYIAVEAETYEQATNRVWDSLGGGVTLESASLDEAFRGIALLSEIGNSSV